MLYGAFFDDRLCCVRVLVQQVFVCFVCDLFCGDVYVMLFLMLFVRVCLDVNVCVL